MPRQTEADRKSDTSSQAAGASTSKGNQSQTQDPGEQTFWEVLEILDERAHTYKVSWAGLDPVKNKPWDPTWVDKSQCDAPDLVRAWKAKKAKANQTFKGKGKQRSKRDNSTTSDVKKAERRHRDVSTEATAVTRSTRSASRSMHKRSPSSESASNVNSAIVCEPKRFGPPVSAKRKKSAAKAEESGFFELASPYDSVQLKIGPLRQAKRRRVELSLDQSAVNSKEVQFADRPPDEVIPETQQACQSDDVVSTGCVSTVDSAHSPRTTGDDQNSLKSQLDNDAGTRASRKSHLSRLKVILPVTGARPMRRLTAVSPSAFKPYLPTQDPIEDFSSPEKSQKKRTLSGTIQKGTPVVAQNPESAVLVQEMEEAFVGFSGGYEQPTLQSTVKSIGKPSAQVRILLPASPRPSLLPETTLTHPGDRSVRVPLPSTASTQLADIDSQSQVVYVPDSQITSSDFQEKLRERDEMILSLRDQVSRLEEDAEAALLQDGESEMQIMQLQGELETLRKAQATVADKYVDQSEELASVQDHVIELEASVTNMRDANRLDWRSMFEERVRALRAEGLRWRGMYYILLERDLKTNDDVRRKAAEHPELCARVTQLEAKVRSQEDISGQLMGRLAEQEKKNGTLQLRLTAMQQPPSTEQESSHELQRMHSELKALREANDMLHAEKSILQDELTSIVGVKTRLENLLCCREKLDDPLTESQSCDLFVCRYVTNGEPCHGLFTSEAAVQVHALKTHYSFISEGAVQ
ncbi:hypothetical protein BC835DRAFT_285588 [Cytidiella melzeri]|nr:hypothetical protein BC835DRAFT_285588 [Cytidiella melzeri]